MITKEEEYQAEVCKITGFAFIMPFAKVVLNISYIELSNVSTSQLLYMLVTLSLACIGAFMILKGKEILREER